MQISIPPPPTLTKLYIEHGLLKQDLLSSLCSLYGKQTVIIADRFLEDLYIKDLASKLHAITLYVPQGEAAKTRKTKEDLESALLSKKLGRDCIIVAVGGGATLDVAGFVASTYLRGVPLILVPTTLLAMVDACIGGKTAINTEHGKNLIGTFYPPKAIIIDIDTLSSLPEKEKKNGIAEIIKMGLIANPELFMHVKRQKPIEEILFLAIEEKIHIVEKDPYEEGIRRILNFGHTIAHGLEALSDYTIPHGIAVAIGCVVESHLSMQLGYLTSDAFRLIIETYDEQFSLTLPKMYERSRFFQTLFHDKKTEQGNVRFVILSTIGKVCPFEGSYCKPVSLEELTPSLKWMESHYA